MQYSYDVLCPVDDLLHLVQAPRSPHDRVYVLPLLTIKMNKGTGTPPITTPPALQPLCPWAASWHRKTEDPLSRLLQ